MLTCVGQSTPDTIVNPSVAATRQNASLIIEPELAPPPVCSYPGVFYVRLTVIGLGTKQTIHIDANITSSFDVRQWYSSFVCIPATFLSLSCLGKEWQCCVYLDVFVRSLNQDLKGEIIMQCARKSTPCNPWVGTRSLSISGFSETRTWTSTIINSCTSVHSLACLIRDNESPLKRIYALPRYCTKILWVFDIHSVAPDPDSISPMNIVMCSNSGCYVPMSLSTEQNESKVSVICRPRQPLAIGTYELQINPTGLPVDHRIRFISDRSFPEIQIRLVVA